MPSNKNDICRVYTGHMIFLLDDSAKHGHREIFDFEMHCERTCVINEQMPCDSRGERVSANLRVEMIVRSTDNALQKERVINGQMPCDSRVGARQREFASQDDSAKHGQCIAKGARH